MEFKLSKYVAGFHAKQYPTCSSKNIETWRAILNKDNKVGAIIVYLSKTFDITIHNLLCKLKAYGFNKNALTFTQSYLTNRHHRAKVGEKFSKWQKVSTGVPQGSILRPLFFNIFINDLFLFIETTTPCNYADDKKYCVFFGQKL